MIKFFKKNLFNIFFAVFIILLIIPQTRLPIMVFVQRVIAMSPGTVSESNREVLADYNWSMQAADSGKIINLQQSENKVVIINLWATWCPPCVAEMPSFQALFDTYGDKVDFYFISSEEQKRIIPFLEKNGYSLPVFSPLSATPNLLNSNSLPTTYLISKKGEIIIDKVGVANWNSRKMHDILNNLLKE